MSARAEELATTFEQANQQVIELGAGDADLGVTCPAEGWTAAALGAHVGGSHFGIVEHLIKPIVAGQELEPFDLTSFNEGNAKQAAENAALPREQILTLLRDHGAMAAAFLRGLSDEELDRTTIMPVFGTAPVTAQQVSEWVLIGHPLDHANSLRQGLGQGAHQHELQAATA